MGRFESEMTRIQNNMTEPYISFQWETGYVVMAQSRFNKLTSKQKKQLMAKAIKS